MMKVCVFLLLLFTFISVQCQDENEDGVEFSHYELGRRYDGDSTAYTQIRGSTLYENDLELRYVALNTPVTFMDIRINANVKTFQFVYLNESYCLIKFRGITSSWPLKHATVKIYGPSGSFNENTGKFEFNVANKTLLLEKVKMEDRK